MLQPLPVDVVKSNDHVRENALLMQFDLRLNLTTTKRDWRRETYAFVSTRLVAMIANDEYDDGDDAVDDGDCRLATDYCVHRKIH